ncbi:ABC transporter ATP-binding protein/permease [Tissierella sp. MSJ-40]|uniref:ABC transporter ATP-binding protein/permease n=1 Tax=Tissierella simiarum TaxID=2841534 RepID=A0ABS6E4T8_9FIRM|nr:ABC transporter ATP-binding protein [Tissierella simiarum]MBU5437455.1 ABC transporter ATP-binding protein/permease [Tissierella simiarum]
MKIFKFAKKHIIKYKFFIFLFLLSNIVSWTMSILLPYITGTYIDLLLKFNSMKTVGIFSIELLAIGIISIITSILSNYFYIKAQTNAMFDLNAHILDHVKKMPILYFNDKDSTYLNQRINSDCNTITSFVINSFPNIIINSLTLIVIFCVFSKINIYLTLLLLILIPVYLFIYKLFERPLYDYGYEYKESQSSFFSQMDEQLYNIDLIKLNAAFDDSSQQFRNSFLEFFPSVLKYSKISYLFSSTDSMMRIASQVILFFFGGTQIINKKLSIGQFTIMSSYFNMIMNCISFFLNFGKSYQDALVSYNRIIEILNNPKEINGSRKLESINTIELYNVSFSYNNSSTIIENFSYEFNKGKIYSIIGKNGTGKSTLAKLILGILIEYYKGKIYYNDIEIKDLDLYDTRKKIIGVSEQEPKLMSDTILNNITYGLNTYDYRDIDMFLNIFNMNIDNFKNGINTNIYESSNNISGGEKLKFSLIKTFLKDPDVIILDEPTSALDTNSIDNLINILQKIKKDKIIIIITHNQNILNIADEIIDTSYSFNSNSPSFVK